MSIDIHRQRLLIVDYGSQYTQLIARRVREAGVYCEIHPFDAPAAFFREFAPRGVVLSGGPETVTLDDTPRIPDVIFELGVPILGICYGMQLGCQVLGAKIIAAQRREYGRTTLSILEKNDLFANIPDSITAWASHGDQIGELSDDFVKLATTDTCPYAAVRNNKKKFFGVQFHPEVSHTPKGSLILKNFLYDICRCSGDWKMSDFVSDTLEAVRSQVSDAKVICGLSGGVDSSVVASLMHKAIGDQLVCIFVDNGLLRKNEREDVVSMFRNHFHMDLRVIDWSQQFLAALRMQSSWPRELFIRTLSSQARRTVIRRRI